MTSSDSPEYAIVYVREKGEIRSVNAKGNLVVHRQYPRYKTPRLFDKDFSVKLCIDNFPTTIGQRSDHFVFTYNQEGSLRYTVKSLFDITLLFIADNAEYIDSLVGFPEQMADKLFAAAEEKQKFTDPLTSTRALKVFSEAYGELVLKSLCLRDRCLLLSERIEEIRVFHRLESLDLHGCRLGDSHDIFRHLTSDAFTRLVRLFIGDNCLSDEGLQRLTAPVRVMKKGLESLQQLDLSSNPFTEKGLGYLTCFQKLQQLNISETNVKISTSLKVFFRNKMGMELSVAPLKEFLHSECKTEGWAEEIINQWEMKASELPKKDSKPRTNALQFYGRKKFVRERMHSICYDAKSDEKTIIHFHKSDPDSTSQQVGHSTGSLTKLAIQIKKRKLSTEQENNQGSLTAKRQALCNFSAEDLKLLNSY
ncbi:hypothetical protein P4O66_017967 [Electrophorus voltai]|uniref:Leucine-rich repeat-containing protein 42 n=2 Tax=Electrophorus TaxID=8004 RepID=A0A4W4EY91_ELEEL|nr:leucine-rich repeat-containing protein 42 [Electrophorus electricus]KAK1786272.1 hypothetical protein P4O66_017967 [Electrophorus voltai]